MGARISLHRRESLVVVGGGGFGVGPPPPPGFLISCPYKSVLPPAQLKMC